MKKWEIDVPVLIIFYKRNEQLKQTFEAVRKARPSTLLFWQDGPRSPEDYEGIMVCREIVENIDWDCKVYRKYNETNYGCDPSTYYSHKWAFSIVDKCIVLEDDFVANKSFFLFCKELLDRYENDERINHICGMNLLGDYEDCPNDYFFGCFGTNAWASWSRVVNGWDETYSFLKDQRSMRLLKQVVGKSFSRSYKKAIKRCATGIPYWETILYFDCLLHSRLAIISKKNLVNNIGMTADSTHSKTRYEFLTSGEKKLFNIKTYDLNFPIRHPSYVIADNEYYKKLSYISGKGHWWISFYRKAYHTVKYLLHGELIKRIKEK